MAVQLANPVDASKMPPGKLVTLKGDFFVITQNKVSYLFVQNARVLYDDPFEARAQSSLMALPQMASVSGPSDKTIAGPSTDRARQDASPAPKDMVAQNSASGPAPANVTTVAPPSRAPRIKTELALACLLGMGRDGCQAVFVGAIFNQFILSNPPPVNAYVAWRLISNCVSGNLFGCHDGALERVDYLGTNPAGGDVYTAKFMHHEKTYVLSQPTPDGKIPAFWIVNRPANWIVIKKELVELQPPVLPARTIYSREP